MSRLLGTAQRVGNTGAEIAERKRGLRMSWKVSTLCDKCEVGNPCLYCKHEFEPQADREYILKSEATRVASGYCHPSNIAKEMEKLPSVAIPNKTEPKQALYEIRETIDDWWDKRIITNHTVYKMLRKLVEEKMYRD